MHPRLLATITMLAAALGGSALLRGAGSGVMVEKVAPGIATEAGLESGDVLEQWHTADGPGGTIASPLELRAVFAEHAPRRAVELEGRRDGEARGWTLPAGRWTFDSRPVFPPDIEARYQEAIAALADGDTAPLAALGSDLPGEVGVWLRLELGDGLVRLERWEEAETAFTDAGRRAEAAGETRWLVWTFIDRAAARQRRQEMDGAAAAYAEAVRLWRTIDPRGLGVAAALSDAGINAWYRGDLPRADELWSESLGIYEERAPGSFGVASLSGNLGIVADMSGDLERADELHRRALAIHERLAPDGLDVASTLSNLGTVALYRGDLPSAERDYRRSAEIYGRLVPDAFEHAMVLGNLGIVSFERGDLATAEELQLESLRIFEELDPTGLDRAIGLEILGAIAHRRGDWASSEGYHRQVLEIRQRVAPESLGVATTLNSLGVLALERGDATEAASLHRRALAIQEELAPDSLDIAASATYLGLVAAAEDEPDLAEKHHRRALELRERIAPESLAVAASVAHLAEIAFEEGALEEAIRLAERALGIRERLAPDAFAEIESVAMLARLRRDTGDRAAALALFARAVASLERQHGRLGGGWEARAVSRARYADIYREHLELLVAAGRDEAAFHLLERSRAQGLLWLLAERDVSFDLDLPPELETKRRLVNGTYDRAQEALAEISPAKEPDAAEEALRALEAARLEREAVEQEIRAAAPRLARLQFPAVVDATTARSLLAPGTVALAFGLGEASSHLFVLTDRSFRRVALPLGAEAIRAEVLRFRHEIQKVLGDQTELRRRGRHLYDLLLAPAAAELASATRVQIVPDGALHLLPFAALVSPRNRWLVEEVPLSTTLSLTLFGELGPEGRRPRADIRVAAFGAPTRPTAEGPPGARALGPLPASRDEVAVIVGLFGDAARAFTDDEATEGTVMANADVDVLHFATHGILDRRIALNSALALAVTPDRPDAGNGLLQGWEIMQQLRLDAELVTLSACSTALGQEVAGEGMIGLTRAFQFAGARSVLASLWNVADEATAELMARFYRDFGRGTSKDEALATAQERLIAGPVELADGRAMDASHPFYWAAFQLYGSWE